MSKSGKLIGLPIVNARAAGIDIGSRIQVASVPPELSDDPVRTVQSFTVDFHAKLTHHFHRILTHPGS